MLTSIRFISLLFTALLVGTMFGIWLGFDPAALSPQAYVEMQQNAIRALNVWLPILGMACIAFTAALAMLTKRDKRTRNLLIVAVLCLSVAGLITRFANQPINAVITSWNAHAPPPNWAKLRDTWWYWHVLRTIAGLAALALALLAALGAGRQAE